MTQNPAVWGVHMGEHVGSRPIESSYVAIGWPALGDLRQYPDREALKNALAEKYPEKKRGLDQSTLEYSIVLLTK